MAKFNLFFCLFLLCSSLVLSQEILSKKEEDSIQKIINQIPDKKQKVNFLNELFSEQNESTGFRSIPLMEYSLHLSKDISYEKGIAEAYHNLAFYYGEHHNFIKSIEYYNLSAGILRKIPDQKGLAKVYKNTGMTYFLLGDYPKALEHYNQSLILNEKFENMGEKAILYNYIGLVFLNQKIYDKALLYQQKSLKIYQGFSEEKKNEREDYLGLLMNMGKTYSAMKDYENAEKNFMLALNEAENIKNKYTVQGISYNNLGFLYEEQGNYVQAESYYLKGLQIGNLLENKRMQAYSFGDLGAMHLKQAKETSLRHSVLEKSISELEKSTSFFNQMKEWDAYQEYMGILSEAYYVSGNYKKAYDTRETQILYKDSISGNEKEKEFLRKELNFEYSRKQDSIKMAGEKEIAIRETTLKEKEKQTWLLLAGFIVASILGALLFYQNRLRKKKNEELDEANRTKTRFFNILNHDLRSPVSNLLQFLYIQKETPGLMSEEDKNNIQNETISSTENLLATMEDLLLWSKSQMENFKPNPKNIVVKKLFEEVHLNYSDNLNGVSLQFKNPENIKIFTDKNYLKTIIRNLTSNAIKALANTSDPEIIWKAQKEKEKTVISITDNGPGGTDEKFRALYDDKYVVGIKTGLGLHLVRDMAKAIHCRVIVKTELGKGTTISLIFPLDSSFRP